MRGKPSNPGVNVGGVQKIEKNTPQEKTRISPLLDAISHFLYVSAARWPV